jgi:hypothetical protein
LRACNSKWLSTNSSVISSTLFTVDEFSQKLDKLDGKVDKLSFDLTDLKVGQVINPRAGGTPEAIA